VETGFFASKKTVFPNLTIQFLLYPTKKSLRSNRSRVNRRGGGPKRDLRTSALETRAERVQKGLWSGSGKSLTRPIYTELNWERGGGERLNGHELKRKNRLRRGKKFNSPGSPGNYAISVGPPRPQLCSLRAHIIEGKGGTGQTNANTEETHSMSFTLEGNARRIRGDEELR